jgi:hypothetical protein
MLLFTPSVTGTQRIDFRFERLSGVAIFVNAEWQKLGASASNSLPFLTHPRKSLFPPFHDLAKNQCAAFPSVHT